jgi:hypothetical protein
MSRHNFPPTLKEILEIFMDIWCPPIILRKFIQALYMRGEGLKKGKGKCLLVGKQPISCTHLCSLLVGGNFKFIMSGQFYWSITTKGHGGARGQNLGCELCCGPKE